MTEEELTMIPMKLTSENASGTDINWGHNAAPGVVAREAKSGALLKYVIFRVSARLRVVCRCLRDECSHVTDARH